MQAQPQKSGEPTAISAADVARAKAFIEASGALDVMSENVQAIRLDISESQGVQEVLAS